MRCLFGPVIGVKRMVTERARDTDLGYARQACAELGKIWSPRRLDKSLELGNNI